MKEELDILKMDPHFLRVFFLFQFFVFFILSSSSDDKIDRNPENKSQHEISDHEIHDI